MDKEKIIQAGTIAKQVVAYAKQIIKPGLPLIDIANQIDQKILDLNAKPAFPVNLSINEQAAHCTPKPDSQEKAHGLLKVDIGVHNDGYVADTAFSLNLDQNPEHQKLIEAAEAALTTAIKEIENNITLQELGTSIQKTILSKGAQPIVNLSGHSIEQYNLHAGLSIPNINNPSTQTIQPGLYALEPFTTLKTATGQVRDSRPSSIYRLESQGNVRDPIARKILQFIKNQYNTLPFCTRWLVKEFGPRANLALQQLESQGILHQYAQLVEASGAPVAQAEHTVFITEKEKVITTN